MELGLGFQLSKYKPHLIMTCSELTPSMLMILHQSLLSKGISGLVLVMYEQAISSVVLSALAFFIERKKRPPLTLRILCYSFLLGFLQTTVSQMLLTLSLQFVGATYQSIALNTCSVVIFVLAVAFRQESFRFRNIYGQAKMWGVTVSAMGATVMVVWRGPALLKASALDGSAADAGNTAIGTAMLAVAVVSSASWYLLVGHVSHKYPAELSLSAMMSICGTIQTSIITSFFVKRQSWELKWEGGLVLIAILYGGIVTTGLSSYVLTWCIHKKGSVFTAAFCPLLIVYSFLLETFILKKSPHLGSFIGAALVVMGLYMLLWGKSKDRDTEEMKGDNGSINAPLI